LQSDKHPTESSVPAPSPWVERWLGTPRGSGQMLDFASGSGRHALLGVRRGFDVTAIDRDKTRLTLTEGRGCNQVEEDLERGRWTIAARRFEVVVVTHYLFRPRLALLCDRVEVGGRLIYETFADGNARFGRPANPAFLLADGELFDVARRAGLVVVAYEHGLRGTDRPALIQRVVAARPPFDVAGLPLEGVGLPRGIAS
jgi:hypothetical protein